MNDVLLFAGTTEGRRVAEACRGRNVTLHVCVATEYGEALIEEAENVHVLSGRLNAEGVAALLRETTGLPVTLWDERRTTVDAHNILMAGGKNAKQRKKTVDAVAASLMLEGYLTFKKRQK